MTTAILQARITSKRLPEKVLAPILGKPMLGLQIERVKRARTIDRLVLATSQDPSDDRLEKVAKDFGTEIFRGSLDDVLDRFFQAAKNFPSDTVVRLTGDCPLIDPVLIDRVVEFLKQGQYDYVSNALNPTFPDGLDTEAFRFSVLENVWKNARLKSEREHVTPYIYNHPKEFKIGSLKSDRDLSMLRWTVDESKDLELVRAIYEALYEANPSFGLGDILALLEKEPQLRNCNSHIHRNEGYDRSLRED